MSDTAPALALIDDRIVLLQGELAKLTAARDVLVSLTTPAREQLALPPPDPPENFGDPPTRRASLPDGVSENSTLKPDLEIDGVKVFFTAAERKLWDILFEAEDGVFVSMAVMMRETTYAQQSIYAYLKTMRDKLKQTNYAIENKQGVGYQLARYGGREE